jgi:hypothetical protein
VTGVLGLDYSGSRPSGAAVARAGFGFVVRYLPNGLTSPRVNVSATEVADMRANGVAVALVWESLANRAAQGRAAGIADATMAIAQATVVGLPDSPIYFAVDFDIPDYNPSATSPRAKLGPVGDYFDGVASVLDHTRIGVYGGYWAVRRCLDAGLASWAWQTAAWSGGQVDPRIHLFQRIGYVVVDGVQCDVNEARQNNFGQNASGGDDMTPDDLISPDGLLDASGKQVTDKAKNFWGYGDHAAQDSKAVGVANGAKLDAILAQLGAAVTAEQQRDAELLAAIKSTALASVDPQQIAAALTASGLPQAVVSALLEVLSKAAVGSTSS